MKKTLSILAVAAALFGCALLLDSGSGESAAAAVTPSNTFTLVANGDEGVCTVTRGDALSDSLSRLTVAPNCRQLLPGVEQAKFWREQNDGVVAFSANGVDPIVTFSVADGDGYESYAPATPILSLAADRPDSAD
ncbi:hypothetical protein [Mesorhizobium sp. ES1-1]|uniref:hypothetical protein n=1 Tax=Mesorhizobium sp. ES1-1 TaxID=2876629 RepID=UPI001CCB52FC|nr:hypothetical protein [Mesorhizobium sp. ES1-1]MBZ9676550.1 hypothetical protein [Mesorhizobium sp. ES1-1]